MEIAILLFAGITALDAIGHYEVLSRIPDAHVKFVATKAGTIRTDNKMCTLFAEFSLKDVPHPNIIVIPGGWSTEKIMKNKIVLDWIKSAHKTSTWTTSVCTGSLVLASAGLLKGKKATSHWTAIDELAKFGAIPTHDRVVKSGKIVTSAGVSAGIDMALQLSAWIGGDELAKTIQLSIEYDPMPPFPYPKQENPQKKLQIP